MGPLKKINRLAHDEQYNKPYFLQTGFYFPQLPMIYEKRYNTPSTNAIRLLGLVCELGTLCEWALKLKVGFETDDRFHDNAIKQRGFPNKCKIMGVNDILFSIYFYAFKEDDNWI